MKYKLIKNFKGKILVIGAIYNQINKLKQIFDYLDQYQLVILIGNICYPFDNEVDNRIKLINKLFSYNNFIYVAGDLDYQSSLKNEEIESWLLSKPNIVSIEFYNSTKISAVCGGLLPNYKLQDLYSNLEIVFVSRVGDTPWHLQYGGKMGYVISNNPLAEDKDPDFFNYSARIGNKFKINNKIYAQEVDEYGLKKTLLI